MKHVDLLLFSEASDGLSEVAQKIFYLLGIPSFEERDSENYFGGSYFLGRNQFGDVKVMLTSDAEHMDLPFWLRLEAWGDATGFDDSFVDEVVRSKLIASGFRVALVQNLGLLTEKRIDY